ncbi:MAG: protein translocase subunit SecF [Coriobacteriales bacterium]|jgi:SecD/SecF fusion protein
MKSLRPHRQFNFVGLWKKGFILSGILIALAIVGFIVSFATTGSALTLGTEFSGGTSIQINNTGSITEDQVTSAFNQANSDLGFDSQISSIQTSTDANGNPGFIVKTTDTDSTHANQIMDKVESSLGIDSTNVQIETIGASWGASVVWSSILAFILSCVGILIVIAARYREPRMGVVALITLFHDMIIVLGVYAWAGMFIHMEITSDVIAALLAIIGYSLYDTIVAFHRINKNASPQMKCSLKTCANRSINEIIVRSLNTSITSILPVLLMLILGTDTLLDFAFAMFCGMVVGVYSTLAISAPIYTVWKCRQPEYARLEKKYPYEVVQSTFTKQMLLDARKESIQEEKEARKAEKEQIKAEKAEAAAEKKKAKEEKAASKDSAKQKEKDIRAAEKAAEKERREAEKAARAEDRAAEKAERVAEKTEKADGAADEKPEADSEAPADSEEAADAGDLQADEGTDSDEGEAAEK